MSEYTRQLTEKTAEVEKIIQKYLPPVDGLQATVIEAMNYGMTAGGKRLRPLMMLETYRLFGGGGEVVEPFMAAMEMIHNYSLIHDDLPAFDNDEYRRGRKTTHAVYGETMGILAGDGLLNYAYETAAGAFELELSPRTAKAMQILGRKAGIYGMVGGQTVDIQSEAKQVPLSTVHFIHTLKCGALIEGAMLIGAVLAGATQEQQDTVERLAANVGLAFQIQDDILDEIGDESTIGKPVGSDEKNQKSTYASLLGLEASKAEVERLSREAIELLDSLPGDSAFLKELIISLIDREK